MEYINNGDSASSVRTKLNLLIDAHNSNNTTTTTTTDMYGGGETTTTTTMYNGGGETTTTTTMMGGGNSNTLSIKDNGMYSAEGSLDSSAACMAASMGGNLYTWYFQKTAPNTGGDLENGDRVYTDSALMMAPPYDKWYAYNDTIMMMNKFFYVNMTGYVEQLNYCA